MGLVARTLAVPLVLCCCACRQTRPPEAKKEQPPRPSHAAWLVDCDSRIARIDPEGSASPTVDMLAARTVAYLIPPAREPNCNVASPVVDTRDQRLFVASPQTARGVSRPYRILAFRLPDLAFTDAIELNDDLDGPPSLLLSRDNTLLYVSLAGDRTVAYDVTRPRAAHPVEGFSAEETFGDDAYFAPEGHAIFSGERKIVLGGGAVQTDLSYYLKTPSGVSLRPFLDPRRGGKAEFAGTAGCRFLYRLENRSAAGFAVVDGTSGALVVNASAPSTSVEHLRLAPDGAHVLAGEKNATIAVYDAVTGNSTARWTNPALDGARLLCAPSKEQLLFASPGRLALVERATGRVSVIDGGITIDERTRCVALK